MGKAVMPPTPAVQSAATLLDEAIERLINALTQCRPMGQYESDVECFNLLWLIVRHVESVVELASRDLVLLPSAMVVARASYETAIRLLWIAAPDDPFEREVRWLAHLQREEDYHTKMAGQLAKFGRGDEEESVANAIRQFRMAVAAKLPDGYFPLKQIPSFYQMLESLGEERKYPLYIIGSQFAHGTHRATGIYRKQLGTAKILGENVTSRDWRLCLAMSWYSLHSSGERFLARAGGDPSEFLPSEFGTRVQATIDEIE